MFKNMENMGPQEQTAYYKALFKELRNLVILALVILSFYSSCYRPHRIPSGSMIPTLMIGDFILVNNMAYGIRLPFSDLLSEPIYLAAPKGVQRGDVVVFRYPPNPRLNYIKRVVGLPGERIRIENSIVFVNDEPIEQKILDEIKQSRHIEKRFLEANLKQYQVQTGPAEHLVQLARPSVMDQHFSEITLGDQEFFVLGDNRDFSSDSRDWGPISIHDIKGRAMMVWFSLIGPLADEGPMRAKWSRIGTKVE